MGEVDEGTGGSEQGRVGGRDVGHVDLEARATRAGRVDGQWIFAIPTISLFVSAYSLVSGL